MQNQTHANRSLTLEQGAALVALARQTLARHFGETIPSTDSQRLETLLAEQAFQETMTIELDGQTAGASPRDTQRSNIER